MKKYFYIGIACCSIFITHSWAQAQNIKNNDSVITKTIDWQVIDPFGKKPPFFLKYKKCGDIDIDLPEWVKIVRAQLIIKNKFSNDTTAPYGQSVSIATDCYTKDLDFPKATEGYGFFNDKTGQWEITETNKKKFIDGTKCPMFNIYQLKAKNGSGYFMTITNKGYYTDSNKVLYNKQGAFCLYNASHTKQFCGSGYVQYTPHLGSSQSDYTPMLLQFLQTVRFVDDK